MPVSNNELQCNLGNMWDNLSQLVLDRKLYDVSTSEGYYVEPLTHGVIALHAHWLKNTTEVVPRQ